MLTAPILVSSATTLSQNFPFCSFRFFGGCFGGVFCQFLFSYIILYCLLTNFYIGAPIFPLQLKCKLCWSELTLESQHTPVTRAVFHQIWRIDNIQKQKHSSKIMNLISSFNFCSRPIKSNVSHQQLFFIIASNWNKSMFTM